MNGHILPSQNAQYDLGSAEYKIRHLFLSDNSLWIGDKHKISIRNGEMKLRKRKTDIAPKNLRDAVGYDETEAKTLTGKSNVEDFTLNDWKLYARHINMPMDTVNDLFDPSEDFNDENETISISSIDGLESALNNKQNTITTSTDISLNNLDVYGELKVDTIKEKQIHLGVTIESVLLKDQNITAHTISAQNYAVGGTNFVSASRQGNFRDLEVKSGSNKVTFLLDGDTGDLSMNGTLKVDTITNSSGVAINSVLLQNQNITAHTISAQNYAVGGTNFVSASRQGNFRDLEVKSGSNKVTFLLDGDTGDLSMNGILKVDSITNSSGVAIKVFYYRIKI